MRTTVLAEDGAQVTTTEPEWDDDQRELMVALAAWEETLCPACGGPAEECQSPEAEGKFKGRPPTRCHRKDAIVYAQEKASDYKRPGALLWGAERVS